MDFNSLLKAMGIGAGAGQAAGGLFNLFGGGKNPAKSAMNYYNQIPGAVQPYYQPYIDAGKGAMGQMQGQLDDLLGGGTQNKLGESYQESPGYQKQLHDALLAASNASAAGGMAGSPMHQEQAMGLASDLAAKDYQNYMNNQMGLYGLGFGGLGDINKMGFDASKGYGDLLGSNLAQQGALSYLGQMQKNQQRAGGLSNLFGGLGSALPFFF
ncbi:MAG: hypothetical protein AB7F29_13815 [Candidatus Nitrosocosmicus sp.]